MNDAEKLSDETGWQKVGRYTAQTILTFLLSAMIILACGQIAGRMIGIGSPSWIDPLLRYLVLWSGLFGTIVASAEGKHIAIDAALMIIPDKFKPFIELAVLLFATLTSAGLSWASYLFIISEFEYGAPGIFDLPSWQLNMAFPITFAAITIIYFYQLISALFSFSTVGKKA
ncbi:MAG: TRAP transporter small permease subunit [Desulfotalea sp.]